MRRITWKFLEQFTRERGYTVERRTGRMIEWYRNDNHSMIGVCYGVAETYREIINDLYLRSIGGR